MPSRRVFLRTGGCVASGLWLRPLWPLGRVPVQLPAPEGLTFGLFFDPDQLPGLRDRFNGEPLFELLRAELTRLDRAAERRFIASDVRTNDHLFHLLRLYTEAPKLAFLYAMTGDEDAAALAADLIRTILRFPKWDYFLEAGTDVVGIQRAAGSTVAVACCADWLGDFIDDEERAEWLRVMGERGCEPCFRSVYGMRYQDRVVGWSMDSTSTYFEHRPGDRLDLSNWPTILDRTNLKAVPASALAIGAVAYEQRFGASDDTRRWLEQAEFSVRSFGDLYARDGSYDEGLSYANYTSLHLAQASSVFQRFRRIDLYDVINWPGFMTHALELTMPLHNDPYSVVNFGDAKDGLQSAVPFWVAGRSHDRRAQWFGRHRARGHDAWSVIWYDPEIPGEAPPDGPHLWTSDLDWAVARTGYEADDLVVALRSGGPANHEHADRNGLIVKAFGEPLVVDPERPPYSFSDPAWMLRTTAGHSALLIDGQGHQYHDGSEGTNPSDAEARLVRAERYGTHLYLVSDATPAYRLVLPDVESVTRSVVVVPDGPVVLVLDKVVKREAPSVLQARFFAYNKDENGRVEIGDDRFTIHRPAASLQAVAVAPGGVRYIEPALPIPVETARLHPRAAVETQTAALAPLLITVLLPEPGAGGRATATVTPEAEGRDSTASQWNIDWQHGDRRGTCRVFDTGVIPEVEVG